MQNNLKENLKTTGKGGFPVIPSLFVFFVDRRDETQVD